MSVCSALFGLARALRRRILLPHLDNCHLVAATLNLQDPWSGLDADQMASRASEFDPARRAVPFGANFPHRIAVTKFHAGHIYPHRRWSELCDEGLAYPPYVETGLSCLAQELRRIGTAEPLQSADRAGFVARDHSMGSRTYVPFDRNIITGRRVEAKIRADPRDAQDSPGTERILEIGPADVK